MPFSLKALDTFIEVSKSGKKKFKKARNRANKAVDKAVGSVPFRCVLTASFVDGKLVSQWVWFCQSNAWSTIFLLSFRQDSNEQGKAQYGRILFPATDRVLQEILQDKIFLSEAGELAVADPDEGDLLDMDSLEL